MNADEINGHQLDWATCAVCGNSVEPGRGAGRINHRGNTINVCGPANVCKRTGLVPRPAGEDHARP